MPSRGRSFPPDRLLAEQYLLFSWIKANSTKPFSMRFRIHPERMAASLRLSRQRSGCRGSARRARFPALLHHPLLDGLSPACPAPQKASTERGVQASPLLLSYSLLKQHMARAEEGKLLNLRQVNNENHRRLVLGLILLNASINDNGTKI